MNIVLACMALIILVLLLCCFVLSRGIHSFQQGRKYWKTQAELAQAGLANGVDPHAECGKKINILNGQVMECWNTTDDLHKTIDGLKEDARHHEEWRDRTFRPFLGMFARAGICEPIEGFCRRPGDLMGCVRESLKMLDDHQKTIADMDGHVLTFCHTYADSVCAGDDAQALLAHVTRLKAAVVDRETSADLENYAGSGYQKLAEAFEGASYEGARKAIPLPVVVAEGAPLPDDFEGVSYSGAMAMGVIESFQCRVQPWMLECFGEEIAGDLIERNHRFLEESLELVQSCACTAHEAHQLVDYVFGRPVGERKQECGGVMVTLAGLSLANGLDMGECGEVELARIWTKVEQIRAKQAAKPKHSPLPGIDPGKEDLALEAAESAGFTHRVGMNRMLMALAATDDTQAFNLCDNCKHRRLDDGDAETWEYCGRPNYPPGKNWNLLTSVQRHSAHKGNDLLCNGRYWEPMASRGDGQNNEGDLVDNSGGRTLMVQEEGGHQEPVYIPPGYGGDVEQPGVTLAANAVPCRTQGAKND